MVVSTKNKHDRIYINIFNITKDYLGFPFTIPYFHRKYSISGKKAYSMPFNTYLCSAQASNFSFRLKTHYRIMR